jgi:hypothetical protein
VPVFDRSVPLGCVGPLNSQNPVDMVWHDNERFKVNMLKMLGNFAPAIEGNVADHIQNHGAVFDFAEDVSHFVGANGDEVLANVRIVVAGEAKRTSDRNTANDRHYTTSYYYSMDKILAKEGTGVPYPYKESMRINAEKIR